MNSSTLLYSPGKNDECYTPAYAVHAILPYLDREAAKQARFVRGVW